MHAMGRRAGRSCGAGLLLWAVLTLGASADEESCDGPGVVEDEPGEWPDWVEGLDCEDLKPISKQYIRAGRYDEAIIALKRCAELEPNNVAVYYNIAVTMEKMEDLAGAVPYLERAIARGGDSSPKLLKGALSLALRAQKYEQAITFLEKLLLLAFSKVDVGDWIDFITGETLSPDSWNELMEASEKEVGPEPYDAISWLIQLVDLYSLPQIGGNETSLEERMTYIDQAIASHALMMAYLQPLEKQRGGIEGFSEKENEQMATVYYQGIGLRMIYAARNGMVDEPSYARGGWSKAKKERYSVFEFHGAEGPESIPPWALTSGAAYFFAEALNRESSSLAHATMHVGGTSFSSTGLLAATCNHDSSVFNNSETVSMGDVRNFLSKCASYQRIPREILERGAALSFQAGKRGALHFLAYFGDSEVVEEILDVLGGEDFVIPSTHGITSPLHIAAARGHVDVAAVIAEKFPDLIDHHDEHGRTPWDIVCLHAWSNTAQFAAALKKEIVNCNAADLDHVPEQTSDSPYSWHDVDGFGADNTPVRCDFAIAGSMTSEEFIRDFASIDRPVLIRGMMTGLPWNLEHDAWDPDQFTAKFANLTLGAYTVPYANSIFGLQETQKKISMAEYMQMVRSAGPSQSEQTEAARLPYIFVDVEAPDDQSDELNELKKLLHVPTILMDSEITAARGAEFYVGGARSGAPMHLHEGAVNTLIHGKKRWVLLPPAHAMLSKKHPDDFFEQDVPTLVAEGKAFECIQQDGEMLFVPKGWGHAVLNLEAGIGYARRFIHHDSLDNRCFGRVGCWTNTEAYYNQFPGPTSSVNGNETEQSSWLDDEDEDEI